MNNKKPFFSIIIPTYNGESFIDRTIQSVLNQTMQDFEIIIINDGSKDNTGKILSSWKKRDEKIKVFETKGFGGPVEPINLGIQNSAGKFIAFLDHDDTWEPNKLEVIAKKFAENDADMIVSEIYLSENGNKTISKLEKNNTETILSGKYFNTFTAMSVKKEIFDEIGLFDKNIKILPDYEFVIRMYSKNKKVVFIGEPLATHFFHQNNLSSPKTSMEKRNSDIKYILEKHKAYLNNHKKVQSYLYNTIGTISLETNDKKTAVKYFVKSFIVYPLNIKGLLKTLLYIWR